VIEKIAAKLHISPEEMLNQKYDDLAGLSVAGKCGVFAGDRHHGLQSRRATGHLMASLFQASFCRTSAVLTRGHTLCRRSF